MGYSFEIDARAGRVRVVGLGDAEVDNALETLALIATHDDFRPGLRLLVDLRRMTTARTLGDIDEISAYVRRSLGFARIAILTGSPETAAVHHRMRELFEGEVPVGVFTELAAAEAWLGQRS